MTFAQLLVEYVRACFTGIWIESHEHQDALVAIAQLCNQEDWRLATWNIDVGLRVRGAESDASGSDPLAAIRSIDHLPETGPILGGGGRYRSKQDGKDKRAQQIAMPAAVPEYIRIFISSNQPAV